MNGQREDGPIAKMLIECHQNSIFSYCAGQNRVIASRLEAEFAGTNNVPSVRRKRVGHLGVDHLVKQKAEPFHAVASSSSVCSIAELQ